MVDHSYLQDLVQWKDGVEPVFEIEKNKGSDKTENKIQPFLLARCEHPV